MVLIIMEERKKRIYWSHKSNVEENFASHSLKIAETAHFTGMGKIIVIWSF